MLVTSRRRLAALDDAMVISLDILTRHEAAEMLARLAGRPGLEPTDPGVGELTWLCGYLPLAIGMLACELRHHPAWTPAGLAADLAVERDRLSLMYTENLSVGAAFSLSYRDLTAGQRRLFPPAGLHPGPDIDAHAAAALSGLSVATARQVSRSYLRPAPDRRARPRPVPHARPGPRARPSPRRRRRHRRARRRGRPCWTTTCRPRFPLAS